MHTEIRGEAIVVKFFHQRQKLMKFAEALSSLELKSVKQAQIVNKGCDFVICRFVAVIADIAHHTPK